MSSRSSPPSPAELEAAAAIREALTALAEATRAEDGCLAYELFGSASAPGTFVTLVRWTDQGARDSPMTMPHVEAAFAVADGALSGEVAIHPLPPVG